MPRYPVADAQQPHVPVSEPNASAPEEAPVPLEPVVERWYLQRRAAEQRFRVMSLAACTQIYRRYNARARGALPELERDILRLRARYAARFGVSIEADMAAARGNR